MLHPAYDASIAALHNGSHGQPADGEASMLQLRQMGPAHGWLSTQRKLESKTSEEHEQTKSHHAAIRSAHLGPLAAAALVGASELCEGALVKE